MRKAHSGLLALLLVSKCARADVTFFQSTTSPRDPKTYRVKISMKDGSRRVEAVTGSRKFVVIEKTGASRVTLLDLRAHNYTTVDRTVAPFRVTTWVQGGSSVVIADESQQTQSGSLPEGTSQILATVYPPPFDGEQRSTKLQIHTVRSTIPFPPTLSNHDAFERGFPVEFWHMMSGWRKYDGQLHEMRSAFGFVPLRIDISIDGEAFNSTQTSGISDKILPASLFTVPAGYHEVTSKLWIKIMTRKRK